MNNWVVQKKKVWIIEGHENDFLNFTKKNQKICEKRRKPEIHVTNKHIVNMENIYNIGTLKGNEFCWSLDSRLYGFSASLYGLNTKFEIWKGLCSMNL